MKTKKVRRFKNATQILFEPDHQAEIIQSVKKRPNDPCPCGSGKKTKKCCGDKFNVLRSLPTEKSKNLIAFKELELRNKLEKAEQKAKENEVQKIVTHFNPKCGSEFSACRGNDDAKCFRQRQSYCKKVVMRNPDICNGCVYNDESTVVIGRCKDDKPLSEDTIKKLKSGLKKAKAEKAFKSCPTPEAETCMNPSKCNDLGYCLRCD